MESVPDTSPPAVPGPMSATEVARLAGVHYNTVIADIGNGTLIARRSGKAYIIESADAADYIAARGMIARGDAALAGLRERAAQRKRKLDG